MICDEARSGLSQRADDELHDAAVRAALNAHVARCASCHRFDEEIRRVRSRLRVEPVDTVPDLGPAVTARLRADDSGDTASASTGRRPHRPHRPDRSRRPRPDPVRHRRSSRPRRHRVVLAAAIAAVAGLGAGATFVGLGTAPHSPASADVPELVLAAQHDIAAVDNRYVIAEHHWAPGPVTGAHPADGTRTFDARLAYRAPETLALEITETTAVRPPADRAARHLVVDGDRAWERTTRRCSPLSGRVRCPDEPVTWTRLVTGREPFSDAVPVPLDLVSPVASFALAAEPPAAGSRVIAGRRAVGVVVTAAQASPLLDGLSVGRDLRPVHPADRVDLWLDAENLVPLALDVRAADDAARAGWTAPVGAGEQAGDLILEMRATEVGTAPAVDDDRFALPDSAVSSHVDGGFVAAPAAGPADADGSVALDRTPVPGALSAGLRSHRAGTVTTAGGPAVGVRSWNDGRAWLTVRATADWTGGRLFGDLGLDVRPVDLGDAGIGYASADRTRLGLHSAGIDVVVSGSLGPDEIEAVAADLGVVGEAVPTDWAEAATTTLDDAAAATPGLLTAPDTDGFGAPAVRIVGDTVSQVRVGPGLRAFTLTQRMAATLPPPSSGDEVGVEVRGRPGRFSAQRGELEWVEHGDAISLRSEAVGLGELLAIADELAPS